MACFTLIPRRLLPLGSILCLLCQAACVQMPDSVAEELSAPDGIRPNHYHLQQPAVYEAGKADCTLEDAPPCGDGAAAR